MDDHKAGGQGLVQLPGAGVAIVHGGDKAGGGGDGHPLVSGDVQHPPEIQGGVEDSQGLVFRHVDLVQNAETPVSGALVNRSGAETDLPVCKGVRANQPGGVQVHMKRHVPRGASEHRGQVFHQHVFAGGLAPGEQQVFPAQQRGDGLLPNLTPVVAELGDRNPLRRLRGIVLPEPFQFLQQSGAYPFLLQK